MPTIRELRRGVNPVAIDYMTNWTEMETISATADRNIFYSYVAAYIVAVKLFAKTTVAANDTNYWTIQVVNNTGAVDLVATAPTTEATGGTAITSDTAWDVGVDQNLTLAAGDVLQLTATKTAAGADLVNPMVAVVYYWI